jgi:hypothetical protein
MDLLLNAIDKAEAKEQNDNDSTSDNSSIGDLSVTSSAMSSTSRRGNLDGQEGEDVRQKIEDPHLKQKIEERQNKNAISTFGEKLGVNDTDNFAAEKQGKREDEDEFEEGSIHTASSLSSRRSKRNLDEYRENSSDDEIEEGPSSKRLNQEFLSNVHDSKANESFARSKLPAESHHYRYQELSKEEIDTMKLDLLYKISVLNEAGFDSPKKFSIDDSLVVLEAEHSRLSNFEDLQYGLQVMRYGLTNGVSLLESVNENFRVSPLRLKGWSTAVHRDVNKYNPILLELYQTHAYSIRLSPLTKLCIALAFSAMSTHLANTMRSNEEDRNENNMFSSVMNLFSMGSGSKRKPNQQNGRDIGSNNSASNLKGVETSNLSGSSSKQPTMRGPGSP